jgi:nitronate monooxygenase
LSQSVQVCIANHLAAARHGDIEKGLCSRGSESLPFGASIRSVRELLDYLLTRRRPQDIEDDRNPARIALLGRTPEC